MSRGPAFGGDPGRVRFAERLGANIRYHRLAQDLRIEDVAAAAAVGLSYFGKIERGQSEVPLIVALRIAGALGVELSELIAATPVPTCVDAAYRTNGDTRM